MPRILDLRFAETLWYERPRDIRKLTERNELELGGYGSLRHRGAVITAGKGAQHEVQEYWLNEAQALSA
jgi:hypothetical protein